MMVRVVHVYVAMLVLMAIALLTHPPAQTQLREGPTDAGGYQRDYWSLNCSDGEYLIVNDTGSSCQTPGDCDADDDCLHMQISSLPPRTGY